MTEELSKVYEILDAHGRRADQLIPILRKIQDLCGYLPQEYIRCTADAIGVPVSKIHGVATFYTHFTLTPKGKYLIKVCDGTACHVKKSEGILAAIEKELGLAASGETTADGLFTLETVACLGACGLAPVVVINEQVHGAMTPEKTAELLRAIIEEENSHVS